MPQEQLSVENLAHLSQWMLFLAFCCGAVIGFFSERSHFCTMGAISDASQFGSWNRAKAWMLAAAVSLIGFALLVFFGIIQADASMYASSRFVWLSNILGGLLFGFGMVLASGCVSKNLLRVGSGNLKSLVVLLVVAISALACLKGITAVARSQYLDRFFWESATKANADWVSLGIAWFATPSASTTPANNSPLLRLILSLAIALPLIFFALRRGLPKKLWLPSVVIGLSVTFLWWLTGYFGFIPEHPETLEKTWLATYSRRMEALSLVAPLAHGLEWLMFYSDANARLTFGVTLAAGLVLGAFIQARIAGSFRVEHFVSAADMRDHLIGAVLMGTGGVLAVGCSLGQSLSSFATLSLGSMLAIPAIILGAWAALRFQYWLLTK